MEVERNSRIGREFDVGSSQKLWQPQNMAPTFDSKTVNHSDEKVGLRATCMYSGVRLFYTLPLPVKTGTI